MIVDDSSGDNTEQVTTVFVAFIAAGLLLLAVLFPFALRELDKPDIPCPCGCGALRGAHWEYYMYSTEASKYLDDPHRFDENAYMYKDGKRYKRSDSTEEDDWFNDHLIYENFVQPYR